MLGHGGMGLGGLGWGMDPVCTDFVSVQVCFGIGGGVILGWGEGTFWFCDLSVWVSRLGGLCWGSGDWEWGLGGRFGLGRFDLGMIWVLGGVFWDWV